MTRTGWGLEGIIRHRALVQSRFPTHVAPPTHRAWHGFDSHQGRLDVEHGGRSILLERPGPDRADN